MTNAEKLAEARKFLATPNLGKDMMRELDKALICIRELADIAEAAEARVKELEAGYSLTHGLLAIEREELELAEKRIAELEAATRVPIQGEPNGDYYREQARAALAAADAVVTVDGLQERIEDTLAYYQCRETNPKADHPYMGYHAFSEEQREWLRSKKSEAAAEIVRMILDLLRGGEER